MPKLDLRLGISAVCIVVIVAALSLSLCPGGHPRELRLIAPSRGSRPSAAAGPGGARRVHDLNAGQSPSPRALRPVMPAETPSGEQVDPPASAPATVSAQVVDPQGEPVTGGSITSYCRLDGRPIAGGRTRLDAEGRFQVPTCDEGICLSFSHTSMIQGGAWELAGSGSGTRLQARPLARVRGHVVDTHGAAVSAAKISLRALVDDAMALPSFVSSSATSDTEGAFDFVRVEHPPCDGCRQLRGACAAAEQAADAAEDAVFRLVARHPDFAPSEQRLTFNALENLEIRLPPALPPIQGRLLGRDQRPYARSKLHLRSEARPYERQLIEAAPDGRFEFRGLGPGTYTIVAIQDGVDLVRRQGIRAGDGQVDLLGPSDAAGRDLELRFVDGSGSPLSGVVVQGGPVGRSRLPEDGRLEVRAVVPGAYVLYLSRPGGGRIRQVFELQSGPSAQTSFEFVIELRRP